MRLLAKLRNRAGRAKGLSGCLICGDTWNWKKAHYIQMSNTGGSMFPTCEECWDTEPTDRILAAVDELWAMWERDSARYNLPFKPLAFKENARNAVIEAKKVPLRKEREA